MHAAINVKRYSSHYNHLEATNQRCRVVPGCMTKRDKEPQNKPQIRAIKSSYKEDSSLDSQKLKH